MEKKFQSLNPYIAGNPINDPKGFFGREDVFREVMQVLRHPQCNAIVLYGQRRIGKTSVLLQLEQRLLADGEYTPVYLDLQDKAAKSLADVLYELGQRIAYKVGKSSPERANFDDAGTYFRQAFLPSAADAAAQGGLVLLFDEFDVLDSPQQTQAGKKFFPYLREWMAEFQRVHFVFVIGRRPEDLSRDTLATFKSVRAARVSLLDRAAMEKLVRQSEREEGLRWDDSAIETVWQFTKGHPYLAQLLCSVIWENIHEETESTLPPICAEDVHAALHKTLEQGANAFQWIWEGLPPAERVVIAAMAEAGDVVITQEKLVEILNRSGVRIIVRELELAPDTLVEWQLLSPADGGYRFVIPLLRHWVTTHRPLRRVKEELDRLDPLAESLFQTGQQFYRLGQILEAVSQLRQALRINKNHLKSHLLLGRILIELGDAQSAVRILEEAYQYDQLASKSELISALLSYSESLSEKEKFETYERILQLDSHNSLALEKLRVLWKSRAEKAMQRGANEVAFHAFIKAEDEGSAKNVLLKIRHEINRVIKWNINEARVQNVRFPKIEAIISLRDEDALKAFVNIILDDSLVVRGLKVIKGEANYYVSMPSRRMSDGSYRDIAHPISPAFRAKIENTVLHAYARELDKSYRDAFDEALPDLLDPSMN